MTGNEKTALASFLDLTGDYLAGGLRRPHGEYDFTNDAVPQEHSAVSAPAGSDTPEKAAAEKDAALKKAAEKAEAEKDAALEQTFSLIKQGYPVDQVEKMIRKK